MSSTEPSDGASGAAPEATQAPAPKAGVQSVETGLRLLAALTALGPGSMLKTLAERAGLAPPQAHRYLVSFCRAGLVSRDRATGRYWLGPLALDMGMAALRELDVVNVATPVLHELRDALGCTACLALWATRGPTFVQVVETTADVIVSVRAGSVLPLLTSATGRVFGAYLPAAQVEPVIRAELAARIRPATRAHALDATEAQALLADVRASGISTVLGTLNPGIQGIAAPVFDYSGALCGVITAMASLGAFDTDPHGEAARTVKAAAQGISHRMGQR